MHIFILIEPLEGGRFRARAGEPFGLSAEADSAEAAAGNLKSLLQDRLQNGSRVAVLDLETGPTARPEPCLQLEPLPEDDWFFQTLGEAIEENRKREDEANG